MSIQRIASDSLTFPKETVEQVILVRAISRRSRLFSNSYVSGGLIFIFLVCFSYLSDLGYPTREPAR
jgi:hypothetical protein